jgi:hypothetical protein
VIAVTDEKMQEFLADLAGYGDLRCEGHNLRFENPEAMAISVSLNVQEPHQLIHLARLVAHLTYDESHFRSASLWITQWGVWNDHDEAVILTTMERFRQGYGENRSIQVAPGHFFRHDEFVESVACMLQPMLVGWDAYYVPQWSWGTLDYFVFVSHDGFLRIETRTTEVHAKVLDCLRTRGWIRIEGKKPSATSEPT